MLRHLISIAQRATTFLWTVLRTYKKTVTFMLILLITIYWYINVYSAFENMMERLALRLPNDAELAELMKRASNRSCPPLYGKVTVLVAAGTEAIRRSYHVAQDSLQCYLKSTDYVFRFGLIWFILHPHPVPEIPTSPVVGILEIEKVYSLAEFQYTVWPLLEAPSQGSIENIEAPGPLIAVIWYWSFSV